MQPGRKEAGRERKQAKFHNISLYFAIDMGQRGKTGFGKGRELGVKNIGSKSIRHRKWEVQNPFSPSTMNNNYLDDAIHTHTGTKYC